ncbi:hypothetical protein Zm00014a_015012 [Zea mays]|uniref:Uncharacterized protein n=1 Tax=Zea mays TaxID=4577 RepID=A0A3L6D6L2_MAIZE|nr:hypothetical protein Zm00014a_015012 [Zea mays]PWZ04185.1 hypothetical protein Zm00014a_015012 [Zea mays]PWZ04186.1 hypothetical protein Zm00014a_015012 [Zea mays]
MDCGPPDQLPPSSAPACFLNLNWDQSMAAATAGDHLDLVSSPASNSTAADGLALHGISPQPQYGGTPLSSPRKLNLSMMGQFHHYPPMGHLDQFLADPGFAARGEALRLRRPPRWEWLRRRRPGTVWPPRRRPHRRRIEGAGARNGRGRVIGVRSGVRQRRDGAQGASDGNAKKRKASGKGKARTAPGPPPPPRRSPVGNGCKSAEESNGAEENSGKGKAAAQSNSDNGGKSRGRTARPSLRSRPRTTSTSGRGAARRRQPQPR